MDKEKLEIIIITYNRYCYLKRTIETLLSQDSPVRELQITVLDNNSNDDTERYILNVQKNFSNIRYVKNKYNVGLAGNVVKAVELVEKDYFWLIGDDDNFIWTNWNEVESAINNDNDMIFTATKSYEDAVKDVFKRFPRFKKSKNRELITKGILIAQFVFISSSIYKKSLIDDTVIKNLYDGVYTICPHSALFCKVINENLNYYVLKNGPVAIYGYDGKTDVSYSRGYLNENLYPRVAKLSFFAGVGNALCLLKDNKLRNWTMEYFLTYKLSIITHLLHLVKNDLSIKNDGIFLFNIFDLFIILPLGQKIILFILFSLRLMSYIVSVVLIKKDNENNFYIRLLGVKIKKSWTRFL